jgi:hypothetical protein
VADLRNHLQKSGIRQFDAVQEHVIARDIGRDRGGDIIVGQRKLALELFEGTERLHIVRLHCSAKIWRKMRGQIGGIEIHLRGHTGRNAGAGGAAFGAD